MTLDTKIGIVGVGHVGATIAYAAILESLATEIVLIDRDKDKAEGEMFDLNHGIAYSKNVSISVGDYKDLSNAHIVVITAGVSRKEGQDRTDLMRTNYNICKEIIQNITKYNKDCIILVVSNPVDILTYVAYKVSGFPAERVIGSGTKLDTSRFRFFLSRKLDVSPKSIHAYIIGEHGKHAVPIWSKAYFGGKLITTHKDFSQKVKEEVDEDVVNAGMNVIKRKQVTNFAIASSVVDILFSIVKNEKRAHTVSCYMDDYMGVGEISLSTPCVLGKNGIQERIYLDLSDEEAAAFKEAAKSQRKMLDELGI